MWNAVESLLFGSRGCSRPLSDKHDTFEVEPETRIRDIFFTFQNFKVLKTLREKLISIGIYLFSIETNSTNSRID